MPLHHSHIGTEKPLNLVRQHLHPHLRERKGQVLVRESAVHPPAKHQRPVPRRLGVLSVELDVFSR